MLKKILPFILCLFVIACGTHHKVQYPVTKGDKPQKPTIKETKKDIEYTGEPWVENISKPFKITKGLQNRHLSVWASHGKYYNAIKNRWEWQRPNLFCTNEDLYTQTIVVPYLIPMLERAGATVFTPRERDWQKAEVIVDNDDKPQLPYYTEINVKDEWKDSGIDGFKNTNGTCGDKVNPFRKGSTRMAKASTEHECEISYQPALPKSGSYAVYVSYPTHKRSVPDAQYTVFHKGRKTVFNVNQRMGGGTWVYLGTFDFDAGCNSKNRVVLTNVSSHKGVITADAVRFGGGMGNVTRNGETSRLPRALEGSRYYAQWAGAPDSVYRAKDGTDDYKEDIYSRPYMTNWLSGGSCFAPDREGLNVPIELAVGVHSDAGTAQDNSSIIGSLAICTTTTNNGLLATGQSRGKSKDFARILLNNINKDIKAAYGRWNIRNLYDRNYAETRCPLMASTILETLSHQNFTDMKLGLDPGFRFTIARSIYKSILRFTADTHNKPYTVAPLAPVNLCADFISNDTLMIKWNMQADKTEPTAKPDAYILYTATGNSGFDNGIRINGTACKIKLVPNVLYRFKVSAVNEGGESFTTETVPALYNPQAKASLLIVNGYDRLSSPEVIENDSCQGFDIDADPGSWTGKMAGISGRQLCFDKTKSGKEGEGALGYSSGELEGMIIMGNNQDNAVTHARAAAASKLCHIAGCSATAVENGSIDMRKYDCADIILGLEKGPAISYGLRRKLTAYAKNGGNIITSGAYTSSCNDGNDAKSFLNDVLHITPNGTRQLLSDNVITGMGTSFNIYSTLNEDHYAATSVSMIAPVAPAFCALTDSQGNSICSAYDGEKRRSFVMGFPFECIKSVKKQAAIMTGILNFIFK